MSDFQEELDALSKYGVLKTEMPEVITANLNPAFPLRNYQKEALFRFIFYVTDYQERVKPTQLLFHVAPGRTNNPQLKLGGLNERSTEKSVA